MSNGRQNEVWSMIATLAGLGALLAVFFVVLLYAVKALHVVELFIYSSWAAAGFIAAVLAGISLLGLLGNFLLVLWSHSFGDRGKLLFLVPVHIVQITVFGLYMHVLDRWVDGVDLRNGVTEITLTVVFYVILLGVAKLGERLKGREL